MDYDSLSVAELKAECKKAGLPVSGARAALISRLQTADSTPAAAPAPAAKGNGKRKRDDEEDEKAEAAPAAKGKKAATGAAPAKKAKVSIKVDEYVSLSGAAVVDDWGVMLNQTELATNNNKFYVIQMLKSGGSYHLFTRWGRVGEPGQNATKEFPSQDACEKEWAKKFREKTKNDWSSVRVNFANFSKVPGQYGLVDIDHSSNVDLEEIEAKLSGIQTAPVEKKEAAKVAASKLPAETQDLMSIIFDNTMFDDQMKRFEIDVKQLPLGKLGKAQIQKGFEVLEKLEDALKRGNRAELERFTSDFYTIIPHNFGRQRGPVIADADTIKKKNDMLNVLNDIEIAQSLQENKGKGKKAAAKKKEETPELPNPMDENYGLLGASVTPIAKTDKMYKLIETYFNNTKNRDDVTLQGIFEVDRDGEGDRFKAHEKLGNRKLLWHGTNVAVIVAILKTGLRIMPHSGGRVGKGLYFAAESGKSAGYVATNSKGEGFMFLNEVALGKEHHITQDDHTLKAPPKGFDCVIAQGETEPDHSKAETVKFDGKDVVMAMGKPQKRAQYKNSSFSQSEYLVYQENQVRIRYLLKIKYKYGW